MSVALPNRRDVPPSDWSGSDCRSCPSCSCSRRARCGGRRARRSWMQPPTLHEPLERHIRTE